MPGTIRSAVPTAVLPHSLCTAFTAQRVMAARVNEYHDGTTHRSAIVAASRKSWRLSKRLPPVDIIALRNFIQAHPAGAFWFYDPRETSPVFSYDPTGVATAGRYAVRWASDWSQATDVSLTNVGIEIIEVGGNFDPALGTVITATVTIVSTYSAPGGFTGFPAATSIAPGHSNIGLYGSFGGSYANTVTVNISAQADAITDVDINVSIDGTLFYDGPHPGAVLTLSDIYLTVTYSIAGTVVQRPRAATVDQGAGVGQVLNPGLSAIIQRWHVSGLSTPASITFSDWA
jgi:phage-related protein